MADATPPERPARLMLGTVQFGMPYGVANRTGQPAYRDVRAIVETAFEQGVRGFDTAASYGASEQVLGRALAELKIADRVLVVTKVRPLDAEQRNHAERAAHAIEQSVAESRRRLQLDCIPMVLFHRETDAVHLDVLRDLQARGWLQACGVSCDHRPESVAMLAARGAAALQLPGNLLDPRHLHGTSARAAARDGVRIFVRSVFLQGLLVMPEDRIPETLRAAVPVRQQLERLASDAGIDMAELALRYVLSFDWITSALVGVETVTQMRRNLDMASRGGLDADLLDAIQKTVPPLPDPLITPSQWPPPKNLP